MKLYNQVAIVTGASRGIGKAIALELAKNGADIVLNYAGNETAALAVKTEIEAMGSKVIAVKGDVASAEDVDRLFQAAIETFGKIDLLVNNAGITRDALMLRMKEDDWDAVIDTNLKGVFLCSQKAVKQMVKQRSGRIIHISSVVGASGNAGQLNYVAAKAGVVGMTKTMAKEVASRGITVNAVAPGFIETDMTDALKDELKDELKKQIPMGTLGKPEDVAYAVLFLASQEASYITGQTLHVNGGMFM